MMHIFREKVLHTKEQVYPWFSSKTVNGIKLFEHFKKGNTQIERPKRTVSITAISELQKFTIKTEELHSNITKKILKLRGDFRQEEILHDWDDWKASHPNKEWQLITCEMTVTTGTYIRVLADFFSTPALLFSLKRTAVGF
jgi:tRNA U55 pseudouridine synthase TruB